MLYTLVGTWVAGLGATVWTLGGQKGESSVVPGRGCFGAMPQSTFVATSFCNLCLLSDLYIGFAELCGFPLPGLLNARMMSPYSPLPSHARGG